MTAGQLRLIEGLIQFQWIEILIQDLRVRLVVYLCNSGSLLQVII